MIAKLIGAEADISPEDIRLENFPAIIGRGPNAQIQIRDRWISRRHCEIDEINGTLVVTDLGSKNGTFINGMQIEHSPLLPGDRLTVGTSRFVSSYERGAKPNASSRESGVKVDNTRSTSILACPADQQNETTEDACTAE